MKYQVDVKDGQKTGFFLDQKIQPCLPFRSFCKDARGAGLLHTYRLFCIECGNCRSEEKLPGVDASELAVDQATGKCEAERTGRHELNLSCEDVFELLAESWKKRARNMMW